MGKKSDKSEPANENPEGDRDDGAISPRKLRTFESLKNPVYRTYYASGIGDWFGMSVQMMTRSLLVYRITGSGTIIGLMALAQSIPSLLVALYGGAIADRIQKKYLLLTGQICTVVLTLFLGITLSAGILGEENPDSWWILLVSAVLQGIIMGISQPARFAIVPEIVEAAKIMNAMSLTTFGVIIFQMIGPALTGFVIDAYGFATIYYVAAGLSVFSIIFTIRLPRTSKPVYRESSALADIVSGIQYVRKNPSILLIVLFGVCHMVSGMPYQQLMPIFTDDILKVGASGMGILTSVSGVGAMVSTLILASLPNKKRGILMIFSGLVMGLPIIVFSWSTSWPLSLAVIPLAGMGPTIHMTVTGALIQYYVDPEYRGRMQSLVSMQAGLAGLGAFFAGVLSDSIGVQWAVSSMAIFLTAVSISYYIFARPITRLE